MLALSPQEFGGPNIVIFLGISAVGWIMSSQVASQECFIVDSEQARSRHNPSMRLLFLNFTEPAWSWPGESLQ